MSERAYTVTDLDDLRRAVRNKYIWGNYHGGYDGQWGRPGKIGEAEVVVEEMVRTHMIAGHTASDLLASQEPYEDEEDEAVAC